MPTSVGDLKASGSSACPWLATVYPNDPSSIPSYLIHVFKSAGGSGWCGSVDSVQVCEPKGCRFNSQSNHMPGLWARSPAGGVIEATAH